MADEYPKTWIAEDEPEITGTVVRVEKGPDLGYGEKYIMTLLTADGERSVWCRGMLEEELVEKRRPVKGEEVSISYLGKRVAAASGREYKKYKVRCGNEPEVDWGPSPQGVTQPAPSQEVPIAPSAPAPVTVPEDDQDDLPFLWRPESWDAVKTHGWSHFSR